MLDIYVSPDGQGDGAEVSPCHLSRAQELLSVARPTMSGDINIYLMDGKYHLDQPIHLKGMRSDQNGHRIRWGAAEGANPILTGEKSITGWELHDRGMNIWKAAVPTGSNFEHLWLGEQRLNRACSDWNPKGFSNSRRGLKISKDAPDISSWRNTHHISVSKQFMWRRIPAAIDKITSTEVQLDPVERATYNVPRTVLGVADPVGYLVLNASSRFAKYRIENAYELVSDPGEWYLDKTESVVYFKPLTNSDFKKTSTLLYSELTTFFLLDGTPSEPICNIAIEGLRFQYSDGTRMGGTAGFPMGPSRVTTPKPESAVQVNAGRNILIENNCFFHLGYDALHFDLHGQDIKVVGNGFGDIARSAISLNQTNLRVSRKSKKSILPENRDKFFDRVEVSNNYIRVSGTDTPSQGICFSEFARDIKILHNEVRHTGTYAISNNWRYLGWRGHAGNIEYGWNKTSEVGQSGLGDFGAVYVSCANDGFTKVHDNYIDGTPSDPMTSSIYLDVLVDGGEVFNNVVVNVAPRKPWRLFRSLGEQLGVTWLNLIMATNVDARNNWTCLDPSIYRDMYIARGRYWPHRSNRVYDNVHLPQGEPLPTEAQKVADAAGLEVAYQHVKQTVDQELFPHSSGFSEA